MAEKTLWTGSWSKEIIQSKKQIEKIKEKWNASGTCRRYQIVWCNLVKSQETENERKNK